MRGVWTLPVLAAVTTACAQSSGTDASCKCGTQAVRARQRDLAPAPVHYNSPVEQRPQAYLIASSHAINLAESLCCECAHLQQHTLFQTICTAATRDHETLKKRELHDEFQLVQIQKYIDFYKLSRT